MITFEELLKKSIEMNASDLHITVGIVPIMRINGNLIPIGIEKFTPKDIQMFVDQVLDDEKNKRYSENGDIDFSYSLHGIGRFRVNIYKQRGSHAFSIRPVSPHIPNIDKLNLPDIFKEIIKKKRGLIIVAGPTGSGKSTTLAAMINEINTTRSCHIITIEEPIEYLHKHKKSIVDQREIGRDCKSYNDAVKAALREDPDVILVGEIMDLETISTVLTAAETGHLVLTTMNTLSASKTIERLVDVFPPYQQQYTIVQLSSVLEGIISQQLVSKADQEGRVCASEIMIVTPTIKSLIREGKTLQIDSAIEMGSKYGMKSMNASLIELYKKGIITYDEALNYSTDKEIMSRQIIL